MFLASVVDKAICVYNLEHYVTGQFAYVIMYLVLNFAVLASFIAFNLFQFPQKLVSI